MIAHNPICSKQFCQSDFGGGSDCSNWIEGNLRHNIGTRWSVTLVQTSELVEDKTDNSFLKLWKGHINTLCSVDTREKKMSLHFFFFPLLANKFDQIGRAQHISLCLLNYYLINQRGVATVCCTLSWQGRGKKKILSHWGNVSPASVRLRFGGLRCIDFSNPQDIDWNVSSHRC